MSAAPEPLLDDRPFSDEDLAPASSGRSPSTSGTRPSPG